jgi:hypothetical protein
MPRRAIRDTYGIEDHGYGIEIRRLVRAGAVIPDALRVPAEHVEEFPEDDAMGAYGSLGLGTKTRSQPTVTFNPRTAGIEELRAEAHRRELEFDPKARRNELVDLLS